MKQKHGSLLTELYSTGLRFALPQLDIVGISSSFLNHSPSDEPIFSEFRNAFGDKKGLSYTCA